MTAVVDGPCRPQTLVAIGLVLQVVAESSATPPCYDVSETLRKSVSDDDKGKRGTLAEHRFHEASQELVAPEAKQCKQNPAQGECSGERL